MNDADVSGRMRDLIKARGMNQTAVAQKAGFTRQQFNDMLQGRKIIRADYLPVIAKVMGVAVSDFFAEKQGGTGILAHGIDRLSVVDSVSGKEIAVVTHEEVTTAGEQYTVKIIPVYG